MRLTQRLPARFFSRRGFTFIEVLVVSTIIALLAATAVVTYTRASVLSRDARRKRDLAALQTALEVYRQNNGSYPASTGCFSSVTWPGCASPWIPGVDTNYISSMPTDPKQDTTGPIANNNSGYTYNYRRVTTNSYHLITRLERTADPSVNGSSYGYTGAGIYVVVSPQ